MVKHHQMRLFDFSKANPKPSTSSAKIAVKRLKN